MKRKEELERIIMNQDIRSVYQPIISLVDGSILGYEALSRGPVDSILELPMELLDEAKKQNRLWEVESMLRKKSIENIDGLKENEKLFLNVDPDIIRDPDFQVGMTKELIKKINLKASSVVFEITEKTEIYDYSSFKKLIGNYKEQNYLIAIDDAGAGYSGLNSIAEIQPHFIKIDMQLIRNIDLDNFRQCIIKSLVMLSTCTNIKLIAEGIETFEELKILIDLGVQYGQGYRIEKPNKIIKPISKHVIEFIKAEYKNS